MSTIEATKQDQEAKRDLKLLDTESLQNIIEIVNNNGTASNSDHKSIEEILELLRHYLTQLEEPLISHSMVENLSIASDLDLDLQRFKREVESLIHDDTIKSVFECCYAITLDPLHKINATKLAAKLTPIMLDTTGLNSFELITTSINCSTTIARIIAHYPYLFENIEQENGFATQSSNGLEELSNDEYKTKFLENKKIIEKLQYESEIKSSLIEVLVNKVDALFQFNVDALEKQGKISTAISDLSKSDISYLNSSEVVSDDESQKSDEMPHLKINDHYLSNNSQLNGHLSLPVSPMKVDPSQDWAVKEKKYLEHIRKLENKLNSTQTKKRKEEIERLRKKLVESEQQRRSLSNDLKNLQKQVQMSQRRSSMGSSSNSTQNNQNNSKKKESQSSSADQSYDSVSKSDTFDINIEKAKDNIEVKMLTIDEEEYTNLQYLLFTWMVVALKLTAMAEGRSPQNVDKQMLFQKAMDDRLDYASWPALIMEHIK